MADYIVDISSLEVKQQELNELSNQTTNIYDSFDSSYLSRLGGTELSFVKNKLSNVFQRLQKGSNNSSSWFNRYINEISNLENKLSSFDMAGINLKDFKGQFSDMFGKITLPLLKTNNVLNDYNYLASIQTGGHIEKKVFKYKGINMKYYIYIPEFKNGQTTGLPLTVYLHGDGAYKHGINSSSLPKLLSKKGLHVPGIVVMPLSKEGWWDSPKNCNAAAALTRKIAKDLKCDMTRISACGHSNGGCGVHHLVAANTDLFSAYVSSAGATGKEKKFNKIGKAKIYSWGIHGTKDKNVAYSKKNGVAGKQTYERLAKQFPEGTEFTTLKGRDHFIQDEVWVTKYNYKGKMITPLEWLFTMQKYGSSLQ